MFWMLKRPSELVGVTYCVLVGVCTAITVAPGRPAPVLSEITPLIAAVVAPCDQPNRAEKSINASSTKWRKNELFIKKWLVETVSFN